MSVPSYAVKQTAKTALSGKYTQSAIASSVFVFSILAMNITGSMIYTSVGEIAFYIFMVLMGIFVGFPLFLGLLYFFRRLLWGNCDSVVVVFKYFSSSVLYKRAMHLSLILALRLGASALVAFTPSIIVTLLTSERFYSFLGIGLPLWTSNLWVVNSFLQVLGLAVWLLINIRYYISGFLFVVDENMDAAEAVNMSAIISRRTAGDFFWLAVSFIGWAALSLLIAPLIFTIPYFICAYGVHCRYAIAAYNKNVDIMTNNATPYFEG